jgi:tripartite-type tricarboxylate transporter receptor subunit TctC
MDVIAFHVMHATRCTRALQAAAIVTGGCVFLSQAAAQSRLAGAAPTYPVKPIRIIVGLQAGGVADVGARVLAQKLSENLGQPVIVENRPGAGTTVAVERVATSAPDGYTLLLMGSTATVQATFRRNLSYDLGRDLAPISLLFTAPFMVVVRPSLPVRNMNELIAMARAEPGKLNYGSNGAGSTSHLAGALINVMANLKIVDVSYKGGAENVIAAASGEVTFSFTGVPTALPLIQAGRLRALAVTSARRVSFLPDIPTVSEAGLPGYAMVPWYGLAARAGVRKEIVELLNSLAVKALNTPEIKGAFSKQGIEVQTDTPQQFAAFIRSEIARNARLMKAAGVASE